MKFLKLYEEFYEKTDFVKFYKSIKHNTQTYKYISDIGDIMKSMTLNDILDINDDNLLKIKRNHHTLNIKPSKVFDITDKSKSSNITNLVRSYNIKDKTTFEIKKGENSQNLFSYGGEHQFCSHLMKFDCMSHPDKQKFFKIIENNPKHISILYSHRDIINRKISGFVILFHIGDKTYYGRIFGYNIEDAIILEKHCLNSGFINSYIDPDNETDLDLTIQLDEWLFDYYPYFDTFKYLNLTNGKLSNKLSDDNNPNIIRLSSIKGKFYLNHMKFEVPYEDYIWDNFNLSSYNKGGLDIELFLKSDYDYKTNTFKKRKGINYDKFIKEKIIHMNENNKDIDPFDEEDWDEIEDDGSFETWVKLSPIYNDIRKDIMFCHNSNLKTLNGIKKFRNITFLYCINNDLVDISEVEHLTQLTYLDCYKNNLSDLCNFDRLTELSTLSCGRNSLEKIHGLEKIKKLKKLSCEDNLFSDEYIEYLINYCEENNILLTI